MCFGITKTVAAAGFVWPSVVHTKLDTWSAIVIRIKILQHFSDFFSVVRYCHSHPPESLPESLLVKHERMRVQVRAQPPLIPQPTECSAFWCSNKKPQIMPCWVDALPTCSIRTCVRCWVRFCELVLEIMIRFNVVKYVRPNQVEPILWHDFACH